MIRDIYEKTRYSKMLGMCLPKKTFSLYHSISGREMTYHMSKNRFSVTKVCDSNEQMCNMSKA